MTDYGMADCCEGCTLGLQMQCLESKQCAHMCNKRGADTDKMLWDFDSSPIGDPEDYFGSESAMKVYEKIIAIRLRKDLKRDAKEYGDLRPRKPEEIPLMETNDEEPDSEILSELRSEKEDTLQ